ncbi:MAG: hypothetical protein J6F30_10160 [Cellulosilyticum sp.]|nr:hypothetical protein [Cellulosilyticum sp.]
MTETNTEQLKKLFHQDMISLYKQIIKSVKYKPTRLMDYINKYGGYEAAVKYISTESNVQDFAILWEKERLDLSVEALMTKEQYRGLFNEDIVNFCDRKLKEYSYAPNKIEEEEEDTGYYVEEEKIDLAELLKQKELYLPKMKVKEYPIYQKGVGISVEDWKRVLTNSKVVTPNNLDLLLRIYAIGDEVGPKELSTEEGYSSTYPFKEVITALGKRIKTTLKVDVPNDDDGKPIWWHLLFNGGLKDNSSFEWSLKNDLRNAIKELIESGTFEQVSVQSEKSLQSVEEEAVVKKEKVEEKVTSTQKDDGLSAFDRLFEAIMAPTPTAKEETVTESKQESVITKKEVEPIAKPKQMDEEKIIQPKVEAKLEETPHIVESQVATETVREDKETEMVETVQTEASNTDYKSRIKKECIEYYGAICDICGFDFGYTYGEAYESCIQVHHVNHVDDEITEDTHPTKDLIPVCCNCHHVMHSQNPPISVDQMRNMVKA